MHFCCLTSRSTWVESTQTSFCPNKVYVCRSNSTHNRIIWACFANTWIDSGMRIDLNPPSFHLPFGSADCTLKEAALVQFHLNPGTRHHNMVSHLHVLLFDSVHNPSPSLVHSQFYMVWRPTSWKLFHHPFCCCGCDA